MCGCSLSSAASPDSISSDSDYDFENPTLIYDGPDYLPSSPVPLVLVHDGGGTIFSYHCMDPTNRPLWGIHNARFDDGGWWDGGVPEMASYYIDLLSVAMPAGGDIILGGWSMGGLLSIEMAYQLAVAAAEPESECHGRRRPRFRVLGIVMVDSVSPRRLADYPGLASLWPTQRTAKTAEELRDMKLKDKVDLNMSHARGMISRWEKPRWAVDGFRAPPTILLRAKQSVGDSSGWVVDHTRRDPWLGWGAYHKENGEFIREIVDVEGHHFSVFKEENIKDISRKIYAAADKLAKFQY